MQLLIAVTLVYRRMKKNSERLCTISATWLTLPGSLPEDTTMMSTTKQQVGLDGVMLLNL